MKKAQDYNMFSIRFNNYLKTTCPSIPQIILNVYLKNRLFDFCQIKP